MSENRLKPNPGEQEKKYRSAKKSRNIAIIVMVSVFLLVCGVFAVGSVAFFLMEENREKPAGQYSELPPPVPSTAEVLPPPAEQPPQGRTPQQFNPQQMKPEQLCRDFVIHDPQSNLPVASMVIPAGWEATSQVSWNLQSPNLPATFQYEIRNPRGAEKIALYPARSYMTFQPGSTQSRLHPENTLYIGSTVKSERMSPETALKKIVLPLYRPNSRLVGIREHPTSDPSVKGVEGMVETTVQGRQLSEKILVVIYYNPAAGFWKLLPQILTCEKGDEEKTLPLLTDIVQSTQSNTAWQQLNEEVMLRLAQKTIGDVKEVGALGEQYARQGAARREEQMRQYEQRSASMDRIAGKWSDYILDRQQTVNPHTGKTVETDSRYNNIWFNSGGDRIETDSSIYNPNTDPAVNSSGWDQSR